MHCIQCLSLFFFCFFPFVKSKNIVVLRKEYPKFSLFFVFLFDVLLRMLSIGIVFVVVVCLFVLVRSFVDCCWSSFMNFNHYHYFSNASPVKRNAFGVGSRLSAQASTDFNLSSVSTQSFYLSISLSLTLNFFFSLVKWISPVGRWIKADGALKAHFSSSIIVVILLMFLFFLLSLSTSFSLFQFQFTKG